jgi:hypothetical protein
MPDEGGLSSVRKRDSACRVRNRETPYRFVSVLSVQSVVKFYFGARESTILISPQEATVQGTATVIAQYHEDKIIAGLRGNRFNRCPRVPVWNERSI